jgi:hypothetical protein
MGRHSSAASLRTRRPSLHTKKNRSQLQAPKAVPPLVRGSATPNDFSESLALVRAELLRQLKRLPDSGKAQHAVTAGLQQLADAHSHVISRILIELSQMPKTRPSLVAGTGLLVSQTGKQQAVKSQELRAAAQQQYSA